MPEIYAAPGSDPVFPASVQTLQELFPQTIFPQFMTAEEKASIVNRFFPNRGPTLRAFGTDTHLDLVGLLRAKGYADGHNPY